jgi:adenosylcobinamide-GDP ribazoletransferase
VPLPAIAQRGTPAYGRALAYFPLVGLALGAILASCDALLGRILPLPVVSVIDLALLALVSGGLHLDGLADSADGLAAGDRARSLAAMDDSRIGAFGASALVFVLLLDLAALASLTARATAIVTAVTLSRWSMSIVVRPFGAARPHGLAASVVRDARRADIVLSTAVAGVVVGALAASPFLVTAVAVTTAIVVGGIAARRLGGLTGDIYGAIGELVFAATLVAQTVRIV